jgi:hypothetical protein
VGAPDGEGEQEDVDEHSKHEATVAAHWETHLCWRERVVARKIDDMRVA